MQITDTDLMEVGSKFGSPASIQEPPLKQGAGAHGLSTTSQLKNRTIPGKDGITYERAYRMWRKTFDTSIKNLV